MLGLELLVNRKLLLGVVLLADVNIILTETIVCVGQAGIQL